MLDRSKSHQFHYYQPGIGTYVTSKGFSNTGRFHRIRSAYLKAKDSAIGSSFDEHVMGGYKFLMRYYTPGDEIYFIGFSRGSYIARFLAEMLDFIGLLEAGNEELTRFAWKTFAKWQQRRGDTPEEVEEKRKIFKYMKAFRETFSRPVTRIRFMGLFDTVNSVPRFESAWMQRSKFPYTARSSARVIRHAVGIDERRAKFRQDLISGARPWVDKKPKKHELWPLHLHDLQHHLHLGGEKPEEVPSIVVNDGTSGQNTTNNTAPEQGQGDAESFYRVSHRLHHENNRYRAPSPSKSRKPSLAVPLPTASTEDLTSIKSGHSGISLQIPGAASDEDDDDEVGQDVQEVWFPGCHADIGGGWGLSKDEDWSLSHAPLVWMVQEAQRAGLQFDTEKLKQFECCEEFDGQYSPVRGRFFHNRHAHRSTHHHDHLSPGQANTEREAFDLAFNGGDEKQQSPSSYNYHKALELASTKGLIHDCLSFNNGLPPLSVITWRLMEYLPFRRMDLQSDGSWKPIRWPLPCGEVRDIPADAQIHVSAIRRMEADQNYRPGNLIVGGGGRGIRVAPPEYGIGEWTIKAHPGDPVKQVYVRTHPPDLCKDDDHQ